MNLTGFRSHCCEGFQHIRIFQPFEVKLESSVFWLVGSWFFFRRRRKVIASNSRSLPMSAPGKLPVPALSTPNWKHFLECNQSGCGVVHLGYGRCIFSMLCDDQKCLPTQDKQRWQTAVVRVLFPLYRHFRMVQKCIASFDKHPCPLLHSSALAQKEYPSSVSDQ